MPRKLPFGLTDALAAPFANIATHSTLELHIPQGRRPARSLYLATAGITYQGVTYTGTLKGFSAIRHSLNRAADEVELTIRNEELGPGLEFLFYLDALNGAEARVGRYWWQDANKDYHKVLLVGRVSITGITDTEIKLKIVSDFYSNVNVGATRSLTRECGFKFRDPLTCGYSGAELKCNKLLNSADGCLGRHGDPLHRAKFGGFAYIDTASTVSGAAALAAPAANQLVKTTSSTFAQRSAIKFVGATVTDDATNNLTQIDFSSVSASVPWIYVDDATYGVVGDGSTDDRTAIQAVLNAVPSTGAVVMFGRKTYYVSGAVLPKANTVLMGQGYSTVIKCPDAGWTLASPSNMGIINVYNVDNIRITNLRVRGTKVQTDINLSPKLIFAHTVNNLTVDHCWLENTNHEGFWPGNVITNYTIANNAIYDVAVSNTYGGLPAIQLNGRYAVVANNRLHTVGIGIQGSNADQSITGNLIRDVGRYGIGTGDGSPGGNIAVTGNTIEVSEGSSVRYGMYIDGTASGGATDDFSQIISGNTVRVTGTGSGSTVTAFLAVNPRNANFASNNVDITYRGQGFQFAPTVTTYPVRISANNNTVRVKSESAKCVGFVTSVNGASTSLQLRSEGNQVYGLTRATYSSYAYDYSPNSGTPGTLSIFMAGDWAEEGYIRVSTTLSNASGQYDKTPLYWTSSGVAGLSTRNHLQLAEISAPSTPASGSFHLYAKTDGKLYGKNDGGTEYDLTDTGTSALGWINVKTAYGAVGDGTTNDTTAVQNAITAAQTGNKTVYFPAGDYRVTGLTVTGAVRLLGDGPEASVISSVSNAVIVDMTADGTDFFGGRIENLKIKGSTSAGSSQIGLKWDHGSGGMRFHARNLIIQDCGDHGFYWGLAFSSVAENIRITECADYPFLYNAPNQPTNLVDSMYIGRLRSGAVTAFRIKQGELLMRNCNGIDNVISGSEWMRVGRKNTVDGDSTDSGATVILEACNVESFTSRGIKAYSNSTVIIGPNCKFAGDAGTSAASKKAIEFTLEGDGSSFYSQYMPKRGYIDPSCDFNDGTSAYANSEPIHAAGFCPLEIMGLGPGTGGGNQLTTYYNSASSSSQKLARADGRHQKTSITTTTTIAASAIGGYYEVDTTGGAVTLTLPWAGWFTRGQAPVYIVDKGGNAGTNNITIQATSSTINGASTYVLNKNRQGVLLMPNGDSSTAIWHVISRFDATVGDVSKESGYSGDYFPYWTTSGNLSNSSGMYRTGSSIVFTSDILANTDNAGSIGGASSNRFANCYIGSKLTVGANSGSYKLTVTGTPTGTVMLGIVPSSLTSGDIMMYQNLPATTGNISATNFTGPMTGTFDSVLYNSNSSSSTAHAKSEVKTNGASGGDPYWTATISGVLNFSFGLDNSDSDAFVFSASSTLGTSNRLRIDTSGNVALATSTALFQIGGTSSSFPALKRSGTIIESRLADDSGYADTRARQLYVDATLTAGGTTGNQTINGKGAGSVNFAAGASSLTVTTDLCTTSSIVICTILTNDTTAVIKNVVPGSGSFVITLNAAATGETRVGYLIINK